MTIHLTAAASQRVKQFFENQPDAIGLRLGVKKTGCSGFSYVIDITNEITEHDHVFEDQGVQIVIERSILSLLDGTHVDFVKNNLNSEFVFHNPNATGECGCGESFSVSQD